MESHPGVERFNRTAAFIFTNLYEAFPDPVDLSDESIAAAALSEGADSEDKLAYEKSALHVVAWLAAEGLLRYERQVYGAYIGVTLSMKALTILGFTPDVLRAAPEPFIDRLKSALGKGATDAASSGIKQVLGGIFDLALRYGQSTASTGILVA